MLDLRFLSIPNTLRSKSKEKMSADELYERMENACNAFKNGYIPQGKVKLLDCLDLGSVVT